MRNRYEPWSADNAGSGPAIDLALITSILARHEQLRPDDVVFVGGSAASGLATPWSDIDVMVIRDVEGPPDPLHLVAMPHDEMTMDLEVWRRDEVDALLDRLGAIGRSAATDHRAFMRLSDDERDFLHSLAIAIPVRGATELAAMRARIDPALLARLSIGRALVGISNAQTDLLGWHALGDWQSAAFTCRRLVEFAGLALLGAAGCTHIGGKWTVELLRRAFADRAVPPRLLDGFETLADHYHALQAIPPTAEATWRAARACVRFCNLAVLYAQTDGVEIADATLRDIFWSTPAPPADEGEDKPGLSLAVQIRFDRGIWYMLHVADEMFEINAVAVAMLVLIDGRSNEASILAALRDAATADPQALQRSLRDMLLLLDNAGFAAVPLPPID